MRITSFRLFSLLVVLVVLQLTLVINSFAQNTQATQANSTSASSPLTKETPPTSTFNQDSYPKNKQKDSTPLEGQIYTSSFHKVNATKIIGFSAPQIIGFERPGEVINKFVAGDAVYLTGYFQSDMKSKGGIPTFKMILHKREGYELDGSNTQRVQEEYFQPMYVPEEKKKTIELQTTFQYSLFPDVASINYDSHLAYIPHLNFARWITTLSPGTYRLDFIFGIRNELARSTFEMVVTPESQQEALKYYKDLFAKKIDAVTFPLASCQNKAGSIPNISELSQFGKLIKVDYYQAADIMHPWPRDHEVQFNTAIGYGIFEGNNTLEIIQLEFRKDPSANRFYFYALGSLPDHLSMLGPNQKAIKPEILEYGYEMRKENLYICHPW